MRILCLHGVGSSGNILASQLRPFMEASDPSFEFIFVDGSVNCDRGPGISQELDGPFFSYTTGYSPAEMEEALNHLDVSIEELGPFDGILGFSQGAALAISYIYQKQIFGEEIPFRFFLALSSVMPISADAGTCEHVIQKLCKRGQDISKPHSATHIPWMDDERLFSEMVQNIAIPAGKNGLIQPDYDMKVYIHGDGTDAPRLMHPELIKAKLRLPSVHVTGRQDHDIMKKMSDIAFKCFDSRDAKMLEHSGSHHPPQKDVEVKAIIRAMDWAIRRADKFAWVRL